MSFDQEICIDNCGDGKVVIRGINKCDDGNLKNGDGCSAKCEVEAGYLCSGGSNIRSDTCKNIIPPKARLITSKANP